jgi:isoamylase
LGGRDACRRLSFRPWYDSRPRTQQGNNNAYCQDNEISWVDWEIGGEGEALIRFVQQLTALRHKYPILRRSRFLTGVYNEELSVKDVTWINASGAEMKPEEWGDMSMECFGGRAAPSRPASADAAKTPPS